MIRLSGVSFGYPGHASLYENLNVSFAPGGVYGLLGRNGSGKSTLLFLMSGLLRARSGSVSLLGEDLSRRMPHTLASMFLLPEEFGLPKCSFRKYVGRMAPFYPRFSEAALEGCLAEFDMPADMPMGELSMGNRKKAYICFALATNVSLLLLDEPTNGLDILSKVQFRRAVSKTMDEGKTVVISTHQVRDVDSILDHVMIVDAGRVVVDASMAQVSARYAFGERPAGADTADVVYAMRSFGGERVMVENREGVDTPVDLEMLFAAAVEGKVSMDAACGAARGVGENVLQCK